MTSWKTGMMAMALLALGELAIAAKPAVLSWQIKPNPDVFGFNVYRATSRTGPFLRVSKELVRPKSSASDSAQNTVRFEDADVESGRTYYYYVDVVRNSGLSERLTGVVAKTVD
ncbi:hypothetical protein [Dokdonella sp.]|uniref:hypothetical protein n=1 Tax=Dokdonella sp. TaxID=2291710 RepID=UPI003C578FB2